MHQRLAIAAQRKYINTQGATVVFKLLITSPGSQSIHTGIILAFVNTATAAAAVLLMLLLLAV
jgi:hypothetical protein